MPKYFQNSPYLHKIIYNMPLDESDVQHLESLQSAEFYFLKVPFSQMKQLHVLRNITSLRVYNSHVTVDSLNVFTNLKILHLLYMFAEHLPATIPPSIEILMLKKIESLTYIPESIALLPNLHQLKLKHLTSLEYLPIPHPEQNYVSLVKLKLSDCPAFKEFCEHMYRLGSLQIMIVCGAKNERTSIPKFDTMQFPSSLATLKMRYLNIPYDEHDPTSNCFPMNALTDNLTLLSMVKCTVNQLGHRAMVPNLRILVAAGCNLSVFEAVSDLSSQVPLAALSSLQMLDVSHNHLTEISPLPPSLRILDISHNKISQLDASLFSIPLQVLRASENDLQQLPIDYNRISELASSMIAFEFYGNPLLYSVHDVIAQSVAARGNPSYVRYLQSQWATITTDVECDESYQTEFPEPTALAVHQHLHKLQPKDSDVFYDLFPHDMIPSECVLCGGEFSAKDMAYVCKINANDMIYSLCYYTNPEIRQFMSSDVRREQVSHFSHPMHYQCANDMILNRFECPVSHLKFYDAATAITARDLCEKYEITDKEMWEMVKNQPIRYAEIDKFMPALNKLVWSDTTGKSISPMYVLEHWESDDPTLELHYKRVLYSNIDYPIVVDPYTMDVLDGLHRLVCMMLSEITTVGYQELTADMVRAFVEHRPTMHMDGELDEKIEMQKRSNTTMEKIRAARNKKKINL